MRLKVLQTANASSPMRWLWYALIGVCLVVAIVIWASYSTGKSNHRYDRWAELVMYTTVLFGYLLKWGWHYKRRTRFWKLYSILFLTHCVVSVPVFSRGWWPPLLLGVIGSLEIMAFATLIAWAMGEKF